MFPLCTAPFSLVYIQQCFPWCLFGENSAQGLASLEDVGTMGG